jgi:hypothetical protein
MLKEKARAEITYLQVLIRRLGANIIVRRLCTLEDSFSFIHT